MKAINREKIDRYKKLSWEGFKDQEDKNGFYILVADSCDLCQEHLQDIEDPFIYSNTTVVELILAWHTDEARKLVPNFKAVPFTAWYKDNVQIDFRLGQLFEDQLNELKIAAKTGKPYVEEEDVF